MQETIQETPKPLELEFTDTGVRAVFDPDELRRFVQDNEDVAFVVDDGKGRRSTILIHPIRELFSDTHPRP